MHRPMPTMRGCCWYTHLGPSPARKRPGKKRERNKPLITGTAHHTSQHRNALSGVIGLLAIGLNRKRTKRQHQQAKLILTTNPPDAPTKLL